MLGGSWLGEITNFNDVDSNGFSGLPNNQHDMLYIKVDAGTIRYRVHTVKSGWLDWVSKGDPNDMVNGCAGNPGEAIDGVQLYYTTPTGKTLSQAYYRSQTTARAGWLEYVVMMAPLLLATMAGQGCLANHWIVYKSG